MTKELEENTLNLQPFEKTQLAKLVAMLNLRVKELRRGVDLGVGKTACDELKDFFKTFLIDIRVEFPFDVAPEAVGEAPVSAMENLDMNRETTEAEGGSLLPPLQLRRRGEEEVQVEHIRLTSSG